MTAIETNKQVNEPNAHGFTHLDHAGNASMVDVGDKATSQRTATAQAKVLFPPEVYASLRANDGQTKKGAITDIAQIAGIMGAKKTSDLIPLCHPLPLDKVSLDFGYDDTNHTLHITASTRVHHKTGVEMEALTAVSVAALTIYDMCKALSHDICITDIKLLSKTGGKQDFSR